MWQRVRRRARFFKPRSIRVCHSFGKALSLLPRAYAFTAAVVLPPSIRSSSDCLFFRRTLSTSLHTSKNTSAICPTCSAAATSVKQHSKSFASISPGMYDSAVYCQTVQRNILSANKEVGSRPV